MLKVLISNEDNDTVVFPMRDLAIASINLKETITNLEFFARRLVVLSEAEYSILMTTQTTHISKDYITFKDGTLLVFVESFDWRTLTILYGLFNSSDKNETLKEIKSFNELKHLDLVTYSHLLEKFQLEVLQFRKGFVNELEFFNANKLIEELRKRNVHAELYNNKVKVLFENVKVGNEHEGYMTYNNIILFIKSFAIDGFLLRFDNFDYNSYWKIPVVLHPYLNTPLGYNNCLEYLSPNDYSGFANFLINNIKEYHGTGYKTMTRIIEDFQDLRILWNDMKARSEDRIELSKMIIKQKEDLT